MRPTPPPAAPHRLSRRAALRRLGGVSVGVAATAIAPLTVAAHPCPNRIHPHAKLVAQLFAVLNGERPASELDDLVAPDHVFHQCGRATPVVGRAALKQLVAQAQRAAPAPFVLAAVVADSNRVAARWRRTTTRRDPDTGTMVVVQTEGQVFARIAHGQVVETWQVAARHDEPPEA